MAFEPLGEHGRVQRVHLIINIFGERFQTFVGEIFVSTTSSSRSTFRGGLRGSHTGCSLPLLVERHAYSQVSHGPFDIRHRQATFIRGSQSRTAVIDCPRERLATEQPGRELARPSATTGAEDAAVPVSRIGSAVPLITCLGLQHFQHLSPSHHVCNEASVPDRGFRGIACRCGHCCLKRRSTTISSTEPNNVTNP
jgi:hypothetical protein